VPKLQELRVRFSMFLTLEGWIFRNVILLTTTPAESNFILVLVELDISLYLSISYFGYFIVYRYDIDLFTFSMYGSSLES
jgi:hypothetical protein